MLNRSAQHRRKRVKALTDPKPEFVSLVGAGANKTPFRALRADCIEQGGPEVAMKSDAYAVARIEFDGQEFNDQAAVAEWLKSGGYSDAVVEKTDDGFVVSGDIPEDADLIEITGDGFTMFVTEVNPGAEEAQKSEIRKKYDETRALTESLASAWDDSKTVTGVLSAVKHAPPGLMDMTMAMYDAIRNSLHTGDTVAAKAAINEFSSLFNQLLEIFPGEETPTMKAFVDAVAPEVEMTKETTEAVENAEKELDVTNEEEAQKANESTGPSGEAADAKLVSGPDADGAIVAGDEVDNTPEGNAASGPEPDGDAAAEKQTSTPDSPNAVTQDSTEEEVAERVKEEGDADAPTEESEDEEATAAKSEEEDPMAALAAAMATLTQSVANLTETVSKSAEQTDELAQRVAAVEDVRQTRKGADVDEATPSKKSETSISDEMAELRQRSMLGMR